MLRRRYARRVADVEFAGTVVACMTRYKITKPTTAYATHFDANWILTLTIDTADGRLPFAARAEVSFAIHSPTQLLFASAEEAVGVPYGFAVELDDTTGRPRWATLRRR